MTTEDEDKVFKLKSYFKVDRKSRNPMNPLKIFKRNHIMSEQSETFYRDIYTISPLDEAFNSSIKIFEVSQQRFIPKQRDF